MPRVVLLFLCLLLTVSVTYASEKTFIETFSADQFSIEKSENADVIVWPGAVVPDVQGVYQLPEVQRTYLLSPDSRVTGVDCVATDSILIATGIKLRMVTDTMARVDKYAVEAVEKTASHTYAGYWKGNHLAMVVIRPLHYDPVTGNLFLYTNVKLTVEESRTTTDIVVRKFADEDAIRNIKGELEELVVNPENMDTYSVVPQAQPDKAAMIDGGGPPPSEIDAPVKYVIITVDALVPTFKGFAEWKTKQGTNASVITMDWIEEHFTEGVDTPDKIRRFIRHAYQYWGTEWILLGGDHSLVPSRITWIPDFGGTERLSDYYYACLDGDWNLDGDYHYGEYYDDIDLMPEVYVGRAPVNTPAQVQLFIDKVTSYSQSSTYTDYQTQTLIVGSNMFVPGDAAKVGDQLSTYFPASFATTKLYEYNADGSEGNLLTKQPAIDALNTGHNLVFNIHHTCNALCWVVIDDHGRDDIGAADINALTNDDKFGVFYSISCGLGNFEYDCLTRQFLHAPAGGAAAFIASTFRDAPFLTDILAYEFADLVFNQGVTEVGKALAKAKENIMPYALYGGARRDAIICYTLLGDPQMKIWTDTPEPLTVTTSPATFQNNIDYSSITVTVTSSTVPVADAEVTLWYSNSIYETQTTNALGEVVFSDIGVLGSMNMFYIGATKQGYLPVTQTVPVSLLDGAILLLDRIIDDDLLGSSIGNGNGVIEAGETIEFNCNAFNYGSVTAFNTEVDMTSSDPAQINVVSGHSAVGDIASVQALPLQQDLVFHIDPNVPDQTVSSHLSLVTGMNGSSWSETYAIVVNAPVLAKDLHLIDDDALDNSSGDGDGIIETGETIELTIDLRNDGYGDAGLVFADLSSTDPGVSVSPTHNSVQYGSVLARDVKTPPASFVFTYTGAGGAIPFDLTVHDEYSRTTNISFEIISLPVVSSLTYTPYANAIDVSWQPVAGGTGYSYIIYGGEAGSSLDRISTQPVSGASHYIDFDLATDQEYEYQVSVVDQNGNESTLSPVLSAATNPAIKTGLPAPTEDGYPWNVTLADLDRDGIEEILYAKSDKVYAYKSTGASYILGADGVLFTVFGAEFGWTGPTVTDIDNDGFADVLIADGAGTDGMIHCREVQGQSVLLVLGWPKALGSGRGFFTMPVVADLDGINDKEVLFLTGDGDLYVWHADGQPFLTGQALFHDFTSGGASMTSPAVGDVDGDGTPEIVVSREGSIFAFELDGTDMTNFPVAVENGLGDPVIGDIDPATPGNEIAVVAAQTRVHVIRNDGTEPPGWPFERFPLYLVYYSMTAPTLGDVTGDGNIEVLATLNNMLYVLDQNGVPLSGWPKIITNVPCVEHVSSPYIADIDGNNIADIVATFLDLNIYAFDYTGQQLAGFPIADQGGGPIAITRNMYDASVSIVTANDSLFVWECGENHPDLVYAGQRNHDSHRSGYWWGNEPVCADIVISSTPVYVSQVKTISVATSDPDIIYGDENHYSWSAKRGSIQQLDAANTTYTAPSTTGADTIWVEVSDMAGNVKVQYKAFTVSTSGGGGGSCPFLMVWDGEGFVEENTILTQSEYTASGIPVVDHYALKQRPAVEDGYYHLRLEEREDEISYIDQMKLLIVDNADPEMSVRVTPDGQLFYPEQYMAPVAAVDNLGNDILEKVANYDNIWYSSDVPGWIMVSYEIEEDVEGEPFIGYGVAQKEYCEIPRERYKEQPEGDSPADRESIGSLHISYRVDDGPWVDMDKTPPRENSAPMYSAISSFVESGSRVDVKYEWSSEWRLDASPMLFSSDDIPHVNEIISNKATHSNLDHVSHTVNRADNEFAVINKGQYIDLYFPVTGPVSEFATFIVEAKGYYTPMRVALGVPGQFALHPSYPNPFNAETRIKFSLPEESDVRIVIYNVLGQTVRDLVSERMTAGQHSVSWDSRNNHNSMVASGIYLVKMQAGGFEATRKVSLLK